MSADSFKRRVALFQSLKFLDVCIVFQQSKHETDATFTAPIGYVRISEWMEAEFAPVVTDQSQAIVAALNNERRALVAESNKKLDDIDGRIILAMAAPVKS